MAGQVKGWKPRNRGSTPSRSKTLSLLQSVVTGSGFQPTTYTKGTELTIIGGKSELCRMTGR